MADEKHTSSLADRRDPDNGCDDAQIVLFEPNKDISMPASSFTFHPFPNLPWELRRLVWEFALPRNVFLSARVGPENRVPYPSLAFACHEASLVVKELGSMVTAWKYRVIGLIDSEDSTVTVDPSFYMRTWFSPKLDAIKLNPIDTEIIDELGEAARCDLFNLCRSSTTSLIVHGESAHYNSPSIHQIYERYLKNRENVLLNIAEHHLVVKDEAWDIIMAPQMLGATRNATDLVRIDDTAAIVKYLKLWEHCCKSETTNCYATRDCDFGSWMEMAIDGDKRARTRGYMKTYKAWMVEDEEYVGHSVTPEAWFLLRLADRIMSHHGIRPKVGRGHEIMGFTGQLKEGHPLIRELDVKLPEVIPVCTVRISSRCACKDDQPPEMSESDMES